MAYVGSGEEPEGCFLCEAGRQEGDGPAHVVHRASLVITLLNRFPYSSGHALISPLRHVADITQLTPEESASLMSEAQLTVAALRSSMRPEGFNVGLNLGTAAGASVEHVHLHVVPRWAGDTNFMPVLSDIKVLPEHLAASAASLREAFGSEPPG